MSVLSNFKKIKREGKKLVVVTAYDYWTARLLRDTKVDGILIGDCAAMVVHGKQNTVDCDINTIAMHTRAVVRGAPEKFIIAAMPFLSTRKGFEAAMDNVEILMKAGAKALKIEGVEGNEELIRHLSQSGIPVIGHVGLTPQKHHMIGGFKAQGKTTESRGRIVADAIKMEELGCVCVVLEAVPQLVGQEVSEAIEVPCVGVGAGLDVDGQALVLQDMLGMTVDFQPKFVRKYMEGAELIQQAVNQFAKDVREENFPSLQETYAVKKKTPVKVTEYAAVQETETKSLKIGFSLDKLSLQSWLF